MKSLDVSAHNKKLMEIIEKGEGSIHTDSNRSLEWDGKVLDGVKYIFIWLYGNKGVMYFCLIKYCFHNLDGLDEVGIPDDWETFQYLEQNPQ